MIIFDDFIKLLYFIYSLLFSFLLNTFNFQYFLCIIFNLIKKINKNNVLYYSIFFSIRNMQIIITSKSIFLPLNNTLWKFIPLKRLLASLEEKRTRCRIERWRKFLTQSTLYVLYRIIIIINLYPYNNILYMIQKNNNIIFINFS